MISLKKTWVPDDAAPNCMICDVKFTFFKRRHHCRICGRVLCNDCSSVNISTKNNKRIRICIDCHEKMKKYASSNEVKNNANNSSIKVFYHTLTLCSSCFFLKRDAEMIPAIVREHEKQIILEYNCSLHGKHVIIICEDIEFFQTMIKFTKKNLLTTAQKQKPKEEQTSRNTFRQRSRSTCSPKLNSNNQLTDIEDMVQASLSRLKIGPNSDNLPLMVSIQLYRDGSLLSDSQIISQIKMINKRYPKNHNYVLKFQGGLVPLHAIKEFNNLMMRLLLSPIVDTHCRFTLLELTVDRLYDISALDECVLFKSHIHPYVKYHLIPGEEKRFIQEMKELLIGLSTISDINLVVEITMDSPYPNLSSVISYLRGQSEIIRFIILSRERSPNELHSKLLARKRQSLKSNNLPISNDVESVDVTNLMELIEKATDLQIKRNDFIPMNAMKILEQFISLIGYGNYHIRPAAFCGFATALVNTSTYPSYPISKFVDLSTIYREAQLINNRLSTGEKPGLWTAKLVKNALKKAAKPNVRIPDITNYINDDKAKQALKIIETTQFIIVHNNMDFASVDITRRCQCISVQPAHIAEHGFVATCTQCI